MTPPALSFTPLVAALKLSQGLRLFSSSAAARVRVITGRRECRRAARGIRLHAAAPVVDEGIITVPNIVSPLSRNVETKRSRVSRSTVTRSNGSPYSFGAFTRTDKIAWRGSGDEAHACGLEWGPVGKGLQGLKGRHSREVVL